jgi:hypothetical protein
MPETPSSVEHGYLLLADISGYTSFLASTELDHAHEILSDLLEVILARFRTLLTIHKLEGDAVFAYAREASILRGETLLELIESTYLDFRERAKNVRRHTTCTCRACQNIPALDLKFILHHGDYVVQSIGGTRELAGSDVNLAHRLLKNHVAEQTGWHAYALFTEQSLEHMQLHIDGLVESLESYEHLGEVRTLAMDMHARYESLLAARRVIVKPEEALISVSQEFEAPPPVVWDWMNDPAKRSQFASDNVHREFQSIKRPGGRTAAGATTHCVHGKDVVMYETVLDWKPFSYYTVQQDAGMLGLILVTVNLTPLAGDRARVDMLITGRMPRLPDFLGRPVIKFFYTRGFSFSRMLESANQVIKQARAATDAAPEPDPVPAAAH